MEKMLRFFAYIKHGSRFARTVLRNATQVKRLRQDKLHRMDRIRK